MKGQMNIWAPVVNSRDVTKRNMGECIELVEDKGYFRVYSDSL